MPQHTITIQNQVLTFGLFPVDTVKAIEGVISVDIKRHGYTTESVFIIYTTDEDKSDEHFFFGMVINELMNQSRLKNLTT